MPRKDVTNSETDDIETDTATNNDYDLPVGFSLVAGLSDYLSSFQPKRLRTLEKSKHLSVIRRIILDCCNTSVKSCDTLISRNTIQQSWKRCLLIVFMKSTISLPNSNESMQHIWNSLHVFSKRYWMIITATNLLWQKWIEDAGAWRIKTRSRAIMMHFKLMQRKQKCIGTHPDDHQFSSWTNTKKC